MKKKLTIKKKTITIPKKQITLRKKSYPKPKSRKNLA